jgi:8-oxo-dGTP pyrophosphatase MutT (NUDIX family)
MSDMTKLKNAAAVFVRNAEGRILAVSRKHNPNDFGLPGGKLDIKADGSEETFEEGAARELEEETGLKAEGLRQVFERHDGEFHVKTFVPNRVSGEIKTKETGVVKWITEEELLAGCFGEYNKKLIEALKEQ